MVNGVPVTRADEMDAEFEVFDRENPVVWDLFCRFTFERMQRGFVHYSGYTVCERIRWETDVPDYDGSVSFKINNNHIPRYTRKFRERFPEYGDFFRYREQTSKHCPATHLPPLGPADFPEES